MFQIFKVLKSELFYSVLFCHQLYQHQQSRLGRTCNYLLSIAFETKTFNLASLAIPNCNPYCSYRFLNAASTRTCYSRSRYRTIGRQQSLYSRHHLQDYPESWNASYSSDRYQTRIAGKSTFPSSVPPIVNLPRK